MPFGEASSQRACVQGGGKGGGEGGGREGVLPRDARERDAGAVRVHPRRAVWAQPLCSSRRAVGCRPSSQLHEDQACELAGRARRRLALQFLLLLHLQDDSHR